MPAPVVITSPFLVLSSTALEFQPVVAAAADGTWSIEWTADLGAGDHEIFSYVWRGNFSAVVDNQNVTGSNFNRHADTAWLSNGAHVVVYEQGSSSADIYARIDPRSGSAYTDGVPFLVNVGATTGAQYMPEIVSLSGSGFVVAWQDDNATSIRVQRYTQSGVAAGAAASIVVSSGQVIGTFNHDLVALNGGGYAVAHRGVGGNQAAKITVFDAFGNIVANSVDASAQVSGSSHGAVTVAQNANGVIAVAWYDSDGGGVGYRLFTSAMVPLTGDLLVPAQAGATGDTPRLTALLDGRFVTTVNNFGPGNLYGQVIRADGTLDGAPFAIDTGGNAYQPEIETLADGRLVFTWRKESDIYAAMYDPREAGILLNGTALADNYVGSNFNDTFIGSAGADTFDGGLGTGDTVSFANAPAGLTVSLGLPASNTGQASGDSYTGIEFLIGSGFADTLSGTVNEQGLFGGGGDDLIEGDSNRDTLYGGAGADRLFAYTLASPDASAIGDLMLGEADNDTLRGSGGSDTLDGGTGDDLMTGAAGSDIYYVDSIGDQIVEQAGEGFDYAYSSAYFTQWAEVEYVIATGSATLNGTGNVAANTMDATLRGNGVYFDAQGGNDVLYGSNYADVLSGGDNDDIIFGFFSATGADWMLGGAGNDTYYVYETGDVLTEAAAGGTDTVYAYANITLGIEIEQVLLVGAGTVATGNATNNNIFGNNLVAALTLDGLGGDDWLIGGLGNDTLRGGANNDVLQGLGGTNSLEGGTGDDQYFSTSLNDVIVEGAGVGRDTVYANYNILTLAANVEQLSASGGATAANGNGLDNTLYGNNNTVALSMDGQGGNDLIFGSNFNDTLIGGLGNDSFVGGAGADRVTYNAAGNMGADVVYGFQDAVDLVVLSGLGYGAGSIGGAITIGGGANALVTFNSGALAGTTILLAGVNQASITSLDFLF